MIKDRDGQTRSFFFPEPTKFTMRIQTSIHSFNLSLRVNTDHIHSFNPFPYVLHATIAPPKKVKNIPAKIRPSRNLTITIDSLSI